MLLPLVSQINELTHTDLFKKSALLYPGLDFFLPTFGYLATFLLVIKYLLSLDDVDKMLEEKAACRPLTHNNEKRLTKRSTAT